MKRFLRFAGAVVGLYSCGGAPESTRYFRVVYPTTATGLDQFGRPILPDACYQATDLPPAVTPAQTTAESFCRVPKNLAQFGSTSQNVTQLESWTVIDLGEEKYSLMRTVPVTVSGPNPYSVAVRSGLEGRRADNKFLFESTNRSWAKVCPLVASDAGYYQPVVLTVCGDKCVSNRSDPANCGQCGRACPAGMACQSGNCVSGCQSGGYSQYYCDGGLVNVVTDDNNCGACGRVCPQGTGCSGSYGGPPRCVTPCELECSTTSPAGGCGVPSLMNRDLVTSIDFELKGDSVTGNLTQATVYSCVDPGCATDFGARCPNCTVRAAINGRESTRVQEFEQR